MKRFLAKTVITGWVAGKLPDRIPFTEKKVPWWRRYQLLRSPWTVVALSAPFGIFVAWKGVGALRGRAKAQ